MSLAYDLVAPRESLPLCAAHFRCGSRELTWREDEAGFRAAWPYLKRLGYRIENECGEDGEADAMSIVEPISCKPTLLNCLRVWWEANR